MAIALVQLRMEYGYMYSPPTEVIKKRAIEIKLSEIQGIL